MYRDTLWFGLQNLSPIIGKLLQPCYDLAPGHLLIDEWMVEDHPVSSILNWLETKVRRFIQQIKSSTNVGLFLTD